MAAFNVVRFRVKPGRDQEFLDAHKKAAANWPGLRRVNTFRHVLEDLGGGLGVTDPISGPVVLELK